MELKGPQHNYHPGDPIAATKDPLFDDFGKPIKKKEEEKKYWKVEQDAVARPGELKEFIPLKIGAFTKEQYETWYKV